eukprot:gi/632946090/ref/XP_007888385.1/ PREDICTED: titin-like [Callorhinchus milii]
MYQKVHHSERCLILLVISCSLKYRADFNEYFLFVRILEPPSFTVKIMAQEVILGSTVQFRSVVKGHSPLTTKWFKDNRELMSGVACSIWNEGSTHFLELFSAKVSDAGSYTCQAINDVGTDTCAAKLFVKEPPSFIKKLDSSTVLRNGASALFECIVTGTPEIQVTWWKNGHKINAGDKYRMSFDNSVAVLEILGVDLDDSTHYVCEARNEAGSDSCSTDVKVKEPPTFKRKLEHTEVVKACEVTLECEVTGTGPFDVTWYKENKQISSSEKYKMITQNFVVSLYILKVDVSDVGDYKCTVANEVGSCTCNCGVKLKEPPSFVKKIENVTTFAGNSAVFQCLVKGSQPLSISWMKDQDDVKEDNNVIISFENNVATLQIISVEAKHGARYTCQAKNDAGIEKCFATLKVTEPANIIEKADSCNVTIGNPAILQCTVTGTPDLKVKWFKDGKELTSDRHYTLSFEKMVASLRIMSVEKMDSDEYTFEVQNDFGVSSCKASLTVLDRTFPPTFMKKLKDMSNVLGSSMSMGCKISGSLPMSIHWYKDGKEISDSTKYKISLQDNISALEINQLDIADGGIYSCKVSNVAGSAECSGALTVKEPPRFVVKPLSQGVSRGSRVQFKSVVQGTLPLFFKWFKDDKELTAEATCIIVKEASSSFIELCSVKSSDTGYYTCHVTNDAGVDTCTAKLSVTGVQFCVVLVYVICWYMSRLFYLFSISLCY